jgi:hypothetical protein
VPRQQGQNLQTTMARQAKPAMEPRQRRMAKLSYIMQMALQGASEAYAADSGIIDHNRMVEDV